MKIAVKVIIPLIFVGLFLVPGSVSAQPQGDDLCSVFGPLCEVVSGNSGTVNEDTAINYVVRRANLGITLAFLGVIIVSVYIVIKNGVKYVNSQGENGQIEEANKAMKYVFIGIAMLFIGLLGIILFLGFFGGTSLLGSDTSINDLFNPPQEI